MMAEAQEAKPEGKRYGRSWTGLILALVLSFAAGFAWQHITRREITTTRLSPDESMRAVLVEKNRHYIDRNFDILLELRAQKKVKTIFSSPDEGRPVGTERFLWSKDNKRLLLIGRRFITNGRGLLKTGECFYFLYDVPSGRAWCNSHQQKLSPFGIEELSGFNFGEEFTPEAENPTENSGEADG